MKNGFIETIRINTLSSIPPYDTQHQDDYSYLSVGRINDKYGILTENGEEFLPFEYDNITLWGFGLLQLCLNGKLGLLHIKQKHKGNDFYIAKQISCEYDVIDGRYEGVVFLRKFGLYTELFNGRSVRAYLTNPEVLTDECACADVMSYAYKRGLITVSGHGAERVISTETGETISENADGFTLGGYDTNDATVLQQEHNGSSRLLYIGEEEIKEFSFGGLNAYAVTGLNEDGEPETVGFIVEGSHGFMLLDDELRPLSEGSYPKVAVHSEITAYTYDGDEVIFPLRKQRLKCENIKHIYTMPISGSMHIGKDD